MIVGVLDDLVDSILEVIDLSLVVSDVVTVCCNSFGNKCLTNTEILDHKAERGVDSVKFMQFLVKRFGPFTQGCYFKYFRFDIIPEITNLLVKNKFKLLELLSLLLKV